MSIAWTTVLITALLFPGVFFFVGLYFTERFSREVIRSNAIGEVGLAILVALILHLLAYGVLVFFGFDLADFLRPLSTYDKWTTLKPGVTIVVNSGIYTVVIAIFGFACGYVASHFRSLSRHKWITAVNQSMRDGIVTAFVMTTTVENDRVLMYKGALSEFYMTLDGSLTYVVLRNCSRFFMKMEGDDPMPTNLQKLFGADQDTRAYWDYLFIDAKNIANILFDPSPEIKASDKGAEALERALVELRAIVGNAPPGTTRPQKGNHSP
jgi:hypothetical protein